MRLFLLSLAVFFSSTGAQAQLQEFDPFKICANIRTYQYAPPDLNSIKKCVNVVRDQKFEIPALATCLFLPASTFQYAVSFEEGVDCLKKIANKTFTESQIDFCQNLYKSKPEAGTSAEIVIDCLDM